MCILDDRSDVAAPSIVSPDGKPDKLPSRCTPTQLPSSSVTPPAEGCRKPLTDMRCLARSRHAISVLIPDGDTWESVKVLRCLASWPGFHVYVLSSKRHPLARYSRHCAGMIHAAWNTDDQFLDAVSVAVARLRIDVLLPVTLRGVRATATTFTDLRRLVHIVPTPTRSQLDTVHDKWNFHKCLSAHHLPSPPTWNGDVLHSSASSLDTEYFPALLKPTGKDGGFGITLVNDADEMRRLALNIANNAGDTGSHILQSYVPGQDLCLGALVCNGRMIAYTIQAAVSMTEDRFGPQRIMDFVDESDVVALGNRLFDILQWNGIAYVDMRRDVRTGKLVLIDFNPRIGQAVLGGLYAGVNLPALACLLALDRSLPVWRYREVRYAHPTAYMRILADRLRLRRTVVGISFRASGCRSAVADPLPELVFALRRQTQRLQRIWYGRSSKQSLPKRLES